jgi:hypothetical protein
LLQHLVSSLSVSSYSVHLLRADSAAVAVESGLSPLSIGALNSCLQRVTIPDAVTI